MNAEFVHFGEIRLNGVPYNRDVVICDEQHVTLRDKKPSKKHKAHFGHTPLSIKETIPWDCQQLIIGTGTYGQLPVMKKVFAEADERGVKLIVVPTPEACTLLSRSDLTTTNAIIHVTC
ncbi:MAG: hypothetical protein JW966_10630 [Anaerolineae bacterium]|nr:hypothetical protein [Anaerolineae bacterium]